MLYLALTLAFLSLLYSFWLTLQLPDKHLIKELSDRSKSNELKCEELKSHIKTVIADRRNMSFRVH